MPWTEIRSESKKEWTFVKHKGEKPAEIPQLHRTEDGKLKISNPTSAEGKDKDKDTDQDPESRQSKDVEPSSGEDK